MRYPSLRATFRNLVLIAAALPAAGCPMSSGDCDDIPGDVVLAEPLDAELQPLLDACRSSGDCDALCIELIERDRQYDWELDDDTLTVCELDQTGATPAVHFAYASQCVGGRRPDGYAGSSQDLGTIGGFFAEQARLEAASVRAFADLARALAAHRAPRVLIDACRRAAGDEAIHAMLCARIARRHGATPDLAVGPAAPVPTLEALALANAVEGCVREGWAALVATWQAATAADPQIRAAMQRIAPDETAHATLSRAIDRWARRRLDDRRPRHRRRPHRRDSRRWPPPPPRRSRPRCAAPPACPTPRPRPS